MDNLKLQTVYVPNGIDKHIFPESYIAHWLDKQDNRIVLTPGELRTLVIQVMAADPKSSADIDEFLKSKGVEL